MPKKNAFAPLTPQALDAVAARFRVLGDPNRLKLLSALQRGELSVGELVEVTGLTQANVSRHLQRLADSGILSRRKAGLNVFYQIADPAIFEICNLVCDRIRHDAKSHLSRLRSA